MLFIRLTYFIGLDNKDALKKAEEALEEALRDFDGSYTEDEKDSLSNQLYAVKKALNAIGNAEKAAEEIEKLPSIDEVRLADKDEVRRVKERIDALTESEKAMLGEAAIDKVQALVEQIDALAAKADKANSPETGDAGNLALWIALLFIGGGAVTGVAVAGKRKQQD